MVALVSVLRFPPPRCKTIYREQHQADQHQRVSGRELSSRIALPLLDAISNRRNKSNFRGSTRINRGTPLLRVFRIRLRPLLGTSIITTTALPMTNRTLKGRRTYLLLLNMMNRLSLRKQAEACGNRITCRSVRRLKRLIRTNTTSRFARLNRPKIVTGFGNQTIRFIRLPRLLRPHQIINITTRTTGFRSTRNLTIATRPNLEMRHQTTMKTRHRHRRRRSKNNSSSTSNKRSSIGRALSGLVCQFLKRHLRVREYVLSPPTVTNNLVVQSQ